MSTNGHAATTTSAGQWPAPDPALRKNFDAYPFNYARTLAAGRLLNVSRERKIEMTKAWLADQHVVLWQSWTINSERGRTAAADFIVSLYETITERWMDQQ